MNDRASVVSIQEDLQALSVPPGFRLRDTELPISAADAEALTASLRLPPETFNLLVSGRVFTESLSSVAQRSVDEAAARIQALNPWEYAGEFTKLGNNLDYYRDLVRRDRVAADGTFLSAVSYNASTQNYEKLDLGYYLVLKGDRDYDVPGINPYYPKTAENCDLDSISRYLNGLVFPPGVDLTSPERLWHSWDYSTRLNLPQSLSSDPLIAPFVESTRNKGLGRLILQLGTDACVPMGDTVVGFAFPSASHMETIFAGTYTGRFIGKLWDQPYPDAAGNQGFLMIKFKDREVRVQFTGEVIFERGSDLGNEWIKVLTKRLESATSSGQFVVGRNPLTGNLEQAELLQLLGPPPVG